MTAIDSDPRSVRRFAKRDLEDRERQRDRRERGLLLFVGLFIFTNSIAYSLVLEGSLSWTHLWVPIVWLGATLLTHIIISRYQPRRDPFLLPVFVFLAGWGLLMQDRLAPNFLSRQVIWFVMGTAAILTVALLPKTLAPLQRYRYLLLLGGLILLGITLLFGVNPSGNGAALWLPIPVPFWGRIYLQPSELLKILLVIFLASYFTEQEPLYYYRQQQNKKNKHSGRGHWVKSFRNQLPFLGPLLLMWGFTILLLVWQQDLGAAALFFLVFIALLYLATGSLLYVAVGLLLLATAGAGLFFVFDTVVTPRIISWINPWPHASTYGYQIVQSLMAQAAGGVLGQGIGQGFPDYIPVVHSDFVLAAIAEEWGLVGSLATVVCFALLAQRGLRIALVSALGERSNLFHAYLAAGFTVVFSIQAFLIMGGVTKLLPLTGITLPFVSYGGSSLLVSSVMMGFLIYLSADNARRPEVSLGSYQNPIKSEFGQRIERLAEFVLIGFLVLALVMSYWSVWRSDRLLAREDNPRIIETERSIRRGRIVDRFETVLAETTTTANGPRRIYPIKESGPAVGYYDTRYGMAGVEKALDSVLRGANDEEFWQQAWRRLLHIPATGSDVQLTLVADLQILATERMTAQTGGLVLLELNEDNQAEVMAMVSQPGYDPNEIGAQFEELSGDRPGPLFNRATQGLYQPGLLLQPLILAVGFEESWIYPDDPVQEINRPVNLHGHVLRCQNRPGEDAGTTSTWADAVAYSCPGPIYDLGRRVGTKALDNIFNRFQLTRPPDFTIPVAPASPAVTVTDPGLAAIGQEEMTVTPLQMALAYSAIAGDGQIRHPMLVRAITGKNLDWIAESTQPPDVINWSVKPEAVASTRDILPEHHSILETTAVVLSGPKGERDAWYVGLAPADSPRYVLALVVEGEGDPSIGAEIGRAILTAATSRP